MVSTFEGSRPRSTRCNDQRLRSIRPAPTSRITARAISTTTSMLRNRWRPPPLDALWLPSFRLSARLTRRARRAGIRLKTRLVRSATPAVNASTRASRPAADTRGIFAGSHQVSSRTPPYASPRPATALMPVSARLSVNNWPSSRRLPAPRAQRTAISRWRPSARASSRLATLAQAISRRKATAPKSRSIARRTAPTGFVGERQHHGVEPHLRRVEPLGGHGARDVVQLAGGLGDGRPRSQAPGGVQPVVTVIGARRIDLERGPELGRLHILEVGGQDEIAGHHADDLCGAAVDQNRAPYNGPVGAVPAGPETVSENGQIRPVRYVFFSA